MLNRIVEHFNEGDYKYKFVIRLGGFDDRLVIWDFYSVKYSFLGFNIWSKIAVDKDISCIEYAKVVNGWGISDFIGHGMGLWSRIKLNDGTNCGINSFTSVASTYNVSKNK